MRKNTTFGTLLCALAIVIATGSVSASESYAVSFTVNPGNVLSGNLDSLQIVDSDSLLIEEEPTYNTTVVSTYAEPNGDGPDEFWDTNGCYQFGVQFECIDDTPPGSGDADTTYVYDGPTFSGPSHYQFWRNGEESKYAGGVGSPNDWTDPSNAVGSGETTCATGDAFFGSSGEWDTFGFSIPSDTNITGLRVRFKASSDSVSETWNLRFVKGGTPTGNVTSFPGVDFDTCGASQTIYDTYEFSPEIWGVTLSPSDVNNASFGIQIYLTGSGEVYLNWIQITVTYYAPEIPVDAFIVVTDGSEPFALLRARNVVAAQTNVVKVNVFWRYNPPYGMLTFCEEFQISVTSTSYANYGKSLPNCDDPSTAWNATMLNGLEMSILIPSAGNPGTVRITQIYVAERYRNVLYSASVALRLNFTGIQANKVLRVEWTCERTNMTLLTLGLLTPPSPQSRAIIADGSMCSGINEDNSAPIYASDIDGDVGDLSFIMDRVNETEAPGSFSVDRFVVVLSGTPISKGIVDWGGSLCWLIGIVGAIVIMSIVVAVKYRKTHGQGR